MLSLQRSVEEGREEYGPDDDGRENDGRDDGGRDDDGWAWSQYSLSTLLSPPFSDLLATGGPSSLAERVACRSRLPVNWANERLSIAFARRSTEFLQSQLSP